MSSDWDSTSQNVDSVKREKKKTRKEKKTKKEKSSKSETKKTESMTEDLLEMSFDAPAPPSSSSLIDNSYPGSTSPTTHSTTKVKKTKILWLPLSSLSGVFDIFYSIEDMLFNGHDIGKISILFRVINRQSTPLSVEISLSSNSTGSYRLGASNKSPLVTSLSSHLEEIQQLVLDVAPTLNPLQTNTIHWQLHSHTSSSMSNPLLLTDDTTSSALSSCHMPWTILSLFQSQSINENEFQALLTSSPSSSTTSSSSISSFINQATHQNKIQIPLPENQTFSRKQITKMLKLLMSYCHSDCMELIEGQSAISCSLLTLPSSRGAGGERYLTCWLMKYLSSGGGGRGNTSIHIEMRYYGPNSSTLQQIGNEILKSLSLISF